MNAYLRKLENASHNKWAPDRFQKKQSQQILNAIYDELNNYIKKLSAQEDVIEEDVMGAEDYLPDVDQIDGKNREIKSIGFSKITTINIRQKTKVESNSHMETKDPGDDLLGESETTGSVDENGSGYSARIKEGKDHNHSGLKEKSEVGKNGDGDTTINQNRMVKSKQIRIFSVDALNKKYKLIFYPTVDSVEGYIEINRVAEADDKTPIFIKGYQYEKDLIVDKNRLGPFEFIKDEKISLILELDIDECSTMEVKLYAYKG